MEDTHHYPEVTKLLRNIVLELKVFTDSILYIENLFKSETKYKEVPNLLLCKLDKWASNFHSVNQQLIQTILQSFSKDYWKPLEDEEAKFNTY